MKRIKYELSGGLDRSDLESIRKQALMVLDKVGVECPHERTLKRLASDTEIRVEGSRVRFSPDLVERTMEAHKRSSGARLVPEKVTVTGPWNCFNIEDLDTGEVRASKGADVVEMWKLIAAVKGGPVCPVYPTDVEGPLQILFVEKTGIELTDTNGSLLDIPDPEMLELAIDMYKAAGRRYRMMVEFPISPLRLNPEGLEKIWKYRERKDVELYAASAPIPQAGVTAPLVLPGGLVQSVAETYAGVIIVERISEGKVRVWPEFRLELSDMRYMTLAYASPEYLTIQMAVRDVYRYFLGRPRIECCFQSNSRRCDMQAVMDKTALIMMHALGGFRDFWYGAGQLSMDEVFSPAQCVIDQELGRYATHLVQGVKYDTDPEAAFNVISEVGPGGNYLEHETTLGDLRAYFESDIFPRMNVDQWRAAGEPDVWSKAAARAKSLIANYRYELAPAVKRDLDRIWAKAKGTAT